MDQEQFTTGEQYIYDQLLGTTAYISADIARLQQDLSVCQESVETISSASSYYEPIITMSLPDELRHIKQSVDDLRMVLVEMEDRIRRLEKREDWINDDDDLLYFFD